jgi:hypothetical protein
MKQFEQMSKMMKMMQDQEENHDRRWVEWNAGGGAMR